MYQFNLGPEFKGLKKMLKKDLAAQIGISGAMVSRLAKRGMPTDSLERALRWRKRHLEPGRIKGVRFDPNGCPPSPQPARLVAAPQPVRKDDSAAGAILATELAARCTAIALRGTDSECSALMVMELRELLRKLPAGARPGLPVRVWIALVDWVLNDGAEIRSSAMQDELATPEEFAFLVNASIAGDAVDWLSEACDWQDYSLAGVPDDADLEDEE